MSLNHPFTLLFGESVIDDEPDKGVTRVTEADISLDVKETYKLRIQFDPAYKDDFHIRTVDEVLKITYDEHPHIVSVDQCYVMLCSAFLLSQLISCSVVTVYRSVVQR